LNRHPRWVPRALVAGGALIAWALIVWLTGGVEFGVGSFLISSTNLLRPLVAGTLLVVVALAYADAAFLQALTSPRSRIPHAAAVAMALLTLTLGIVHGTFVAGGPDPHGYVSQAALWRRGELIGHAPFAGFAPWATSAFAPLGYVAGSRPGEVVPQYPAGLPLMMAAAQAVAGERAAYYVVPLAGALAVWLTFQLGAAIGGSLAGVIAAATLFASPVFLFQLMFPMSDVPATALWLAAAVLAIRDRPWSLVLSGLAAALAVMTRPNLALLGPLLFLLVLHTSAPERSRLRRALTWGIPAMLGPLAVALIQSRFYGSPLKSGYGDTSGLYAIDYFWTNVTRYGEWLMVRQTPYILLGLAAVPVLRRRHLLRGAWLAAWALAFSVVVALSYVWYLPFQDWYFLRFLLPAFPMLLATAASVLVIAAGNSARAHAIAAALVVIVIGHGLWRADSAFTMRQDQSRYRAAAVEARTLPADAVVISNLHSGSIRYYANRLTLRYEWVAPSEYWRTLRFLEDMHRPVFLMLDDLEFNEFRERYQTVADVTLLDHPMRIINERVRLYKLTAGRD
jgi:hypothetical protein